MSIPDLWLRYETWLKANVPRPYRLLRKGATESQFKKAEKQLDMKFTEDLKSFYQLHNGQDMRRTLLFNEHEFISLQRMVTEWEHWLELSEDGEFSYLKSQSDPEIQPVWWDKHWLPFTENGAGDHLCVDLNPTKSGTYGQIITLYHDNPSREKVANSIQEWFTDYVTGLEQGNYIFLKHTCSIVKKQ